LIKAGKFGLPIFSTFAMKRTKILPLSVSNFCERQHLINHFDRSAQSAKNSFDVDQSWRDLTGLNLGYLALRHSATTGKSDLGESDLPAKRLHYCG
jgi:hypothetical protein